MTNPRDPGKERAQNQALRSTATMSAPSAPRRDGPICDRRSRELLSLCRRAVANIGTRRAEEHIYQIDEDGTNFSIVAGCGSVNYFRDNMYKRLAEAFYNFDYMLRQEPERFHVEEFEIYERFHLALLADHQRPMLQLADDRYRQVKAVVDQRYTRPAGA